MFNLASNFPAGSEPNTTMPGFMPWVGLVLLVLIVVSFRLSRGSR